MQPPKVLDGYAPFCNRPVHSIWMSTRCLTVPITEDNRHLLRSEDEARTKDELPALVRWLEGFEYLIVILYGREQLTKEGTVIDAD